MPRKMSQNSKSITTEKHFTTVPPMATPVKTKAVTETVATTEVATKGVSIAKPALVADLKPLLLALHDLDADIAREAATSLGKTGDAAAVEPLIAVLKNENHYFHSVVRSAAAVSLGQLKDRRAINALVDAVHDPITDPSTEAIRALVNLADPRAVNVLVEVVRNSANFYANSVRRAAVLGLIKLGGDVAVTELHRVAGDAQEDSVIREEAAAAVKSR